MTALGLYVLNAISSDNGLVFRIKFESINIGIPPTYFIAFADATKVSRTKIKSFFLS